MAKNNFKASGVEWFPTMPSSWGINRGKFLFRNRKEINRTMSCDNVLSLTMNGVLHRDELGEGGLLPTSYETFQLFEKDNLVFKLIDLENYKTSRVGIVPEKGIMSSAYIRLESKNQDNVPKYFYWLYFNLYLQGIYNFLGMGVRSTLNPWDLLELPLIIPEKETQKRIAGFLDEKTKVVDELVAKKEKLIEEQRKLTFSLVLGNDTRTKREIWSNVPDTWEIQKAREIFMEVDVRNKPEEELLAVTQDRGVLPKSDFEAQFVSPTNNEGQKLVEKNDFVISLRSFEGGIEFSAHRGIVSPAYTILRLKKRYNTDLYQKYYKYLLKSPQFVSYLNTIIMGIRDGKNISYFDFRELMLPIPPVDTIRSMLAEFEKHEMLARFLNKEKRLFNEYRSSLIYHAVTGKIKI